MPAKKHKDRSEPNTLKEAIEWFSDEDRAHKYLAERRWPTGDVTCPTCGSKAVLYMAKYRRWKCAQDHARRQFSVKVGTVMEDSPLPVGKWLAAMWMVANCKNGVSSYEIGRALDVTQKSAWFMLQRIRLAMQQAQGGGTLDGTIEVDETYVLGEDIEEYGTVEGRLQTLSERRPHFALYDPLTDDAVRCNIKEDQVADAWRAFGRRVAVSGMIRYRKTGQPVSIEAESMYVYPPTDELPTAQDVLGILADHDEGAPPIS